MVSASKQALGEGLLVQLENPNTNEGWKDPIEVESKTEDLSLDANYFRFSSQDFTLENYLKDALQDSGKSLSDLRASMVKINCEIRGLISSKSVGFVEQAATVKSLQQDMAKIQSRVDVLASEAKRIKTSVMEPFAEVNQKSAQLRNVQRAYQYFRQIHRIQQLTSKLQSTIKSDDAKTALLLQEALGLLAVTDLKGVFSVQKDLPRIMEWKRMVQQNSLDLLWKGLRSQSQPDVAEALQVFYNFGKEEFQDLISQIMNTARENSRLIITQSLDMASVHSGASEGTQSRRAALWAAQSKLTNRLFVAILEVENLEKVLKRKRDSATRKRFIELVHPQKLTLVFWAQLVDLITTDFQASTDKSTFLSNVFINEYPRLFLSFQDLFIRLQSAIGASQGGSYRPPQLSDKHFGMLAGALLPYKKNFIQHSYNRVHEKVKLMCPTKFQADTGLPTLSDVTTLTTTIHSELSATEEVPFLQKVIAEGIVKSLNFMFKQLERRIIEDPQKGMQKKRNADIFNLTNRLATNLSSIPQKQIKVSRDVHKIIQRLSDEALALCTRTIQIPILKEIAIFKDILNAGLKNERIYEFEMGVDIPIAKELRKAIQSFEKSTLVFFHVSSSKISALEDFVSMVVQDFLSNALTKRPQAAERRERYDKGIEQVLGVFKTCQETHRLSPNVVDSELYFNT